MVSAGMWLAVGPYSAAALAVPNPQMRAVLNSLAKLRPKPIEKLSAAQARKQPGPPDAVKRLLKQQNRSTAPMSVASVMDRTIPVKGGTIPIRVYKPSGKGPFPVLVYTHGGGWVIANIQAYDASCRALANAASCVVVSVGYRQAPEHKFPTAAEDAYAGYIWSRKNAGSINGDARRVAVAGESAGGNLATVTCLMARDRKAPMPVHQLLVYPITNDDFNTPSYLENAKAKPLNRAMMIWFWEKYQTKSADGKSPYASPLKAQSLKGLPPATIILAEIDPLRSDGEQYAAKLRRDGVPVRLITYKGVTHEFFGMGAVVDEAKQANQAAARALTTAFSH